jgi:transposase
MESEFQTIYPRCAFLDVHKQSVEATTRSLEGERVRQQWGTMTADIEAMADWLAAQGVTHVGMESTGVFWKPIYNILEGRFTMILVNARHLKIFRAGCDYHPSFQ